MIKNSSWHDSVFAKVLIVIFYITIFMAVGLALYLFTRIIQDAGSVTNTVG